MVYQIVWTLRASNDFDNLMDYLIENSSETSIQKFITQLEKKLALLETNPAIYALISQEKQIRRCLISKNYALYYKVSEEKVILLTLFDQRQNPLKLII